MTEDSFHLSQLSLAALDDISISILSHDVIFRVDKPQCVVEFQLHNTAFIIDRTCSTVLDSLRHIIDVDVITEYLTGISVLQ